MTLRFDQAEAIRLADLDGLYQEAAALRMGVSRQTFGRIVESARRAVADAIINRKCHRIDGGEVIVDDRGERTMKAAVPARDGLVDAHFGHKEKKIVAEEKIDSSAGCDHAD